MNAQSKHTPGPWMAGPINGYGELNGIQVKEQRGLVLAVAIGDVPELDSEANARLIAAAPELLRCLRNMIDLYEQLQGHPTAYSHESRAAIAKAEGR